MIKKLLFSVLIIGVLSFTSNTSDGTIEFNYPKNKEAVLFMKTDQFENFEKEWRGEDYYYLCKGGKDDIICSVLFYKLNKDEQKMMVEPFDPKDHTTSPIIPLTYFLNGNLKKYEKNNDIWGEPTDDFMFRQNDITEVEGIKTKQKHMYAYGMFGKDLFINVHLSKINYTAKDSITMRKILADLQKKK
ncbi:hypothetical protein [Flavobacterium sp. LC2016-01]|uniref:hypothetical protein n=1 Tax=Flavobacterium sp. LC2016-01 TaxID=2675876 RepID=UPI0012BA8C2A|nr:hypothetical protein [Flavobacterium sp. LC2016-01]MTH16754.1 hypothetical protein [Flavobacterium sp. LC2016-01]